MWPEPQNICISLIDGDDATEALLVRVAGVNGFQYCRFPSVLSYLQAFDPALPGCVIADFNMPDRGAWELVDAIQAESPGIQIVLLAASIDVVTVVELMKGGVSDVVLKPLKEEAMGTCIARAIEIDVRRKRTFAAHCVMRRNYAMLTPREREIFQLVVSGLPSRGIAQALDRSQKTVEVHRTSIMKKMEARSVVDLVRMGIELQGEEYAASPEE